MKRGLLATISFVAMANCTGATEGGADASADHAIDIAVDAVSDTAPAVDTVSDTAPAIDVPSEVGSDATPIDASSDLPVDAMAPSDASDAAETVDATAIDAPADTRVCTPGASSCVSLARVRTCDATGGAQRESDCASGETCREGSCQRVVCVPGALSCEPTTAARRRCTDDGGGYAPMPCASGQSCREGVCVTHVCTPGSATCASMTERRVCASDGLSATVLTCASGDGCRDGVCLTRLCVPGSATCLSSTMRSVCNDEGFGTTGTACGASQRCVMGSCVDPVCAAGTSSCVDARTVRVCNADGSAFTTMACAASSTCSGSSCSAWVCTPGAVTCPAGATARSTCNADGLGARSEACVAPAHASAPRCGADNTCSFTCDSGFGDCDLNPANGCEASLNAATSCGRCGVVCSTGTSCVAGACAASGATFRVDTLGVSGCSVIDHASATGDDRGGIALSRSQVFVTGDSSTARASLDLAGLSRVGQRHDAMLSDLETGAVYVLLDASGSEIDATTATFPRTITQLGVIDDPTGMLTVTRVPLSAPITVSLYSGIFSGRGRVYIYAPDIAWYQILLPSGAVSVLRPIGPSLSRWGCESWAFWGIAEYFDGEPWAVFAESRTSIVRYRIRDGSVTTIARPASGDFGDMCSITFSPATRRWYFHYEFSGFAGGTEETLGFCPGTSSTP